MGMVRWKGDAVSTRDAIALTNPPSGAAMRSAFIETLPVVTLGLVNLRGSALMIGPIDLLRFGRATVTQRSVEWPIRGGLLAATAGGKWRIESTEDSVVATVTGYRPSLPRPIYRLTQLQVHMLFTRLLLLRMRGRDPAPGTIAAPHDRVRAASVDVAFCMTLARLTGRRSLRRTLLIAAAYHVACWSTTGRTLGGEVMRQRVVAVDGSRLTPAQSLLRLVMLPASWITWRPLHDEVAGSMVMTDEK